MIQGCVFDIQRMSVHDGPGIRTTVFLKGCPLHCLWCHNPESQSSRPELALHEAQCINCGECLLTCPKGNHAFMEGVHLIRRDRCIRCGLCAKACVGALELIGREMNVEEVMMEVRKDVNFYKTSGGGITLSGGEPLMQPVFAKALLVAAKEEGMNTAMETSGYGDPKEVQALMPLVDLWLYDVKETDEKKHIAYTGVGRERILANLLQLDKAGMKIILRCPIIPGFNDREDHLISIAELANSLSHVKAIHVEPYNRLGESKSKPIGKTYGLQNLQAPEKKQVESWVRYLHERTNILVLKS